MKISGIGIKFHSATIIIASILTIPALISLSFLSPLQKITSYLALSAILSLILIVMLALSWSAGWIDRSSSGSVSRIKENEGRMIMPILIAVSTLSGTIGFVFVDIVFGFWGTVLYAFSLIPYQIFTARWIRPHEKVSRSSTDILFISPFNSVSAALVIALLFLTYYGYSGIISVFVLIFLADIVSVYSNKDKQLRIKEASDRALVPFAMIGADFLVYMIYIYLIPGGIGVFLIPLAIIIIFSIFLMRIRKRYIVSIIIEFVYIILVLISLYEFYAHLRSYEIEGLITLLALTAIAGMNLREMDTGFHKIASAFRFYRYRPAIGLIFLVSAVGITEFTGIFSYTHYINYSNLIFLLANISSIGVVFDNYILFAGIVILAVICAMTIRGTKYFSVVLFAILVLGFFYGIYSILSLRVSGIWNPVLLEVITVSVIITAVVVYEPFFRFTKNYTDRIPYSMSLSYQLGNAEYLHGRYDVNLERNKKRNRDLLGAGGFAYVFKGKDIITGKNVVIKVPRVYDEESKSEKEKKEFLADSVRQLYMESRILSQLNHPGIVQYLDYFREESDHYLVEEFADGKNLSSQLGSENKIGKVMSEEETISIALSLLYSLNYIHLHEVYHRDLNPGNIVLSKTGPKIIDFGTSKTLTERRSTAFFSHSQRIGVPCYHPPELDSKTKIRVSASYDTYSVGALICSMLTGKFLDEDVMKSKYGHSFINRDFLEAEIKGKVTPETYFVIQKSLSFNPDDRFQSAFEMIAAINGWKGEFIVTDMGQIYHLLRNEKYSLIFSPKVIANRIFNVYLDVKDIRIYDTEKDEETLIGSISYDQSTGFYTMTTARGRLSFAKKIGIMPEKMVRQNLEMDTIYYFRQDMKGGTFAFHKIF
jgi:serine/threonine protein kinase